MLQSRKFRALSLLLLSGMALSPLQGLTPGVRAQETSHTFPETGKTVSGKFLTYWTGHGGLAQQGYPISDVLQEKSDTDGKTYATQYFERAVFEMHPENAAPNDVLLSLLGVFQYGRKYPNGAPNQTVNTSAGAQKFTQTNHTVGGKFLTYWTNHGGLAQQGYPISDEFTEKSDTDGKTYTVQYFQRAVFEMHPENAAPNDVLLSLLGRFQYNLKHGQATPTAGTPGTSGTPGPVGTPTPFPPVPQPAGSLKLTFWYGLTGANGNIVQQVVNKFNTSQTKYYIDAIQQPNYDDTINKLNTSLAGGALPNIVQIYDIGTQRMIDTKRIKPVQDFVDRDNQGSLVADLEPAVASYYTVNGKLYSMPFNSSAPVLYYDKNAFKEVGLDPNNPPKTYDDLVAAATKLAKKDSSGKLVRSGVDFTLYSWILEQELALQNVTFADPNNGRGSDRATKLMFNRPEAQNWLNLLKKLQDTGVGRSVGRASGTTNGTTMGANFSRGDAAMAVESIANLRSYVAQAAAAGGKVDVGVAPLPRPAGATGGVIIGGASLWITDQGTADQQEGAWQFAKFVAQPETQSFFASNTGYYPTRRAAYDQPEMKAAIAKYPQFQVAVDELHRSPKTPATAGAVFGTFAGTRILVEGAMEQFLLGQSASAQAALDAAAGKANDNLDEYNSTVHP
ncbi:MAG: ABC transporter substrate-binding protein [Chloroflexota bacterium]|nr:ABC transporter substrate-binding protein [Chloroflexota bacterium]